MTELQEQIYSISAGVSTITGGVYFDQAEEGATYPYLVFSFLPSPREKADTKPTKIRLAKVQFDLLGESGLSTLADSLEAALDDVSNYSFTTDALLSTFEDFRTGPFQADRDDSAVMWQLTFQYTFQIQEA